MKNEDDNDEDLLTHSGTSQAFMYPPRLWLPQLQESGQAQRGLYPISFPPTPLSTSFQSYRSSCVSSLTHRAQQHNKHQIDINFKRDMMNQCFHESSVSLCRITARIYYKGAKHFSRKRRAVEVAEMENSADDGDGAVEVVDALAAEPASLVDILAANPGLLRELGEEEVEGLEVMVNKEMGEQELKEWQAVESEVLEYGVEGEDVGLAGVQMDE